MGSVFGAPHLRHIVGPTLSAAVPGLCHRFGVLVRRIVSCQRVYLARLTAQSSRLIRDSFHFCQSASNRDAYLCPILTPWRCAGPSLRGQGLVDLGCFEVELVDFHGKRQFGDGHLVFDRARLLLTDLGGQQIANYMLRLVLSFDCRGDDRVVGRPHTVELQLTRRARGAPTV